MIKDQKIYILGSAWVSAFGNGLFDSKPQFSNMGTEFNYPELQEYLQDLPSRFGRFDVYTRMTFSTAVLALKDAGLLQREGKKNVGIVIGSSSGVYDNDIAYYETTGMEKGSFTSPNLFSYTLPNVALGEIAVFFNFTGPTFCVGNDPAAPGFEAISTALSLLTTKKYSSILAGWVEVSAKISNHEMYSKGAAFTVLTIDKVDHAKAEFSINQKIHYLDLFGG